MLNEKLDASLIGLCIKSQQALREALASGVKAEMFVDPWLTAVWLRLVSLSANDKPTDFEALAIAMPTDAVKLCELVEQSPVARDAKAYSLAVIDAARDREIYRALETLKKQIEWKHKEKPWDGPRMVDEWLDKLLAVSQQHSSHASVKDGADILAKMAQRWEYEHEHGSKETYVTTGFVSIDRQLNGGLTKGAVMTLAARTGEGKSMLGVNIAVRSALAGHRVLYVTIEMDGEELLERAIADHGDALYSRVMRSNRESAEFDAFAKLQRVLTTGRLSICDDSRGKIGEVERIVRWAKAIKPYDLVIIDYVQQFSPPDQQARIIDRVREVSAFIKMQIAKPHHVAVISVAQMNRNAEAEGQAGMRLGNIKESGAIEMDSDVVAMIDHEDANNPSTEALQSGLPLDGLCWLRFKKQRKGSRNRAVPLRFNGKYSRFEEIGDVHFNETP